MSRNALNLMHTTFNKHHKVSHHHSHKLHYHFWQKTRRIKVIKCPPNYNPRRDITVMLFLYLKIAQIQTPTLKLQTVGLCVDLVGHFHDILLKFSMHLIMCISGHKCK